LKHVSVDVVCEKDDFKFWRDTEGDHFRHEPAWERGKVKGAYCVARFANEEAPQIERMSVEEIESVRARSRAKDDGPWVTDFNEMAKKTVIKRASKRWPLSPEKSERFFTAVDSDNAIEAGTVMTDEPVIEGEVVAAEEQPKTRLDAMADAVEPEPGEDRDDGHTMVVEPPAAPAPPKMRAAGIRRGSSSAPPPPDANAGETFDWAMRRISALINDDVKRRAAFVDASVVLDREGMPGLRAFVDALETAQAT
jgi:recombination protein RecT